MTKQDHIAYWVESTTKDWDAIQNMYKAKTYVYALFFAHLSLEKLLKAHWIKDNEGNFPPKTHNLLGIVSKTSLIFTATEEDFLARMDQFSIGRSVSRLSIRTFQKI